MKNSNVSIIVTTYNWKEALELVLIEIFKQSVLPKEVVVADDGSRSDTQEMIKKMQLSSPIPIIYVWQEDKGFRLSMIRNRAIAVASGEYIIQIDGDCVPHKHFVKDHLEIAKHGTYVCGSRMYCTQKFTKNWFATKKFTWWKFRPIKGSFLNGLRIGWLRRNVMTNFRITVKGSNMAFWRKDLLSVNGYDEYYVGWGFEDNDLVARLQNIGIEQRTLKMGALQYHLYHIESQRPSTPEYELRMQRLNHIRQHKEIVRAENGLDKYLNNKNQ